MVVISTVGLDRAFLPRMPALDLEDDALCVTGLFVQHSTRKGSVRDQTGHFKEEG